MLDRSAAPASFARRYWFYLLLPAFLLASHGMSAMNDWRVDARGAEAALLFDWCLFVPALYAIYLRPGMALRGVLLRAVAMSCAGLWIARWFVPDPAEVLLTQVAPLRTIGLALLIVLEAAAFLALMRLTFAERPDLGAIQRQGVPPFVARLLLLEARFWRWVWSRLRGR